MTAREVVPGGLSAPASGTPPRARGSVRRTTSVDMLRPDVLTGLRRFVARARDVATDVDGAAGLSDTVEVVAVINGDHELVELHSSRHHDGLTPLLGRKVGAGFRAAVDAAMPDEQESRSLLHLLLDDLPVAALISAYADMYLDAPMPHLLGEKVDVCSGWRADGLMMTSIRERGKMPIPIGPPAPVLDTDDPYAWHALDRLPLFGMRRRRRLDLRGGEPLEADAMFRDTYVQADGTETVLHEYGLWAALDPLTLRIKALEATPRVLPWDECPMAAASASRLVGAPVADVRQRVRQSFSGTSTCTHLNDLLRSLESLVALREIQLSARDH
jgi:hypothetical protein